MSRTHSQTELMERGWLSAQYRQFIGQMNDRER